MTRRFLRIHIVCILMIAVSLVCIAHGFTEGTSVSSSTEDLYNKMFGFFVIGEKNNNFNDAIAIYESNPQLKTYSDAEKYYRYMCARNYLLSEDFNNAALLFRSLDTFRDSNLYYAYVNGRIAENESRFEDAVGYYIEASDLTTLDCIARMQKCNAKIGDEKKSIQYQEAMNDYELAITAGDQAKVASVRKAFLSLGDYQESKKYAALCDKWLQTQNRKIMISAEAIENVLTISWQDSEDGHSYQLCYRPENSGDYVVMNDCSSPVRITDCIPGTVYEIVVIDKSDKQVSAYKTVSIPKAEKYTSNDLKFVRMDIAGIQKNDIVLTTLSPADIFNDYPEFMLRQEDGAFTAQQLTAYALYASIVYSNTTSEEMDIELYTVLRSSTAGVYKSASETIHLPGDSNPRMLCVNVDTLLDETKKETGLLTAGQYLLEVYVQGQLFCVQAFIIK